MSTIKTHKMAPVGVLSCESAVFCFKPVTMVECVHIYIKNDHSFSSGRAVTAPASASSQLRKLKGLQKYLDKNKGVVLPARPR